MDGSINMDGWIDGWMGGWMDAWMDGLGSVEPNGGPSVQIAHTLILHV